MTEQEYILVTDYKSICCAIKCLRDVCPPNNPHITEEDYETVAKILASWTGQMVSEIEGNISHP